MRILKKYKTKYDTLEIIVPEEKVVALITRDEANERYGDYLIISKLDYDSTGSTSLILKRVEA